MRRVVAAVVAAAMMVVMAACADDGTHGQPALGRALAATRALPRARVELRTTYAGLGSGAPPGVSEVRVIQRAAFDRQRHQASAEADLSELAAAVEAGDQGDQATPPGDYSAPPRLIIDGDSVYAQIGPLAHVAGLEPSTWVRRDLDSFTDQSIDNETAALLLQPLGMLALLERPLDEVRVVGADDVRGVAATHLAARLDLGPPPAGDPEPDPVGDQFRHLGIATLPVDVWVGEDDEVVHRLEFALDASTLGPGAGDGAMTTTFDVYDVGEPIGVEVPAGADVVDYDDLRTRLTDP
jgi:hypothetical protein